MMRESALTPTLAARSIELMLSMCRHLVCGSCAMLLSHSCPGGYY